MGASQKMPFDCHGQPIALPADLENVRTAPASPSDFHEMLRRLEPGFTAMVLILRRERATQYLRDYEPGFVIRDYINFISRPTDPSSQTTHWQNYDNGPRKLSFIVWLCRGFLAHLKRPETKAHLQQRRADIDARDARITTAPASALPPTPNNTETIMTTEETCRRMIEETQKRCDLMLADAQRKKKEILASARGEGRPPTTTTTTTDDDDDDDLGPIRLIAD